MKYRQEWRPDTSTHVIAAVAAMLSAGAGVIHFSAAGDHRNLPVMMAGFVLVGLAQIALAGLLLLTRPSRPILAAALALMLGSVAIWLVSRTSGLPFLPGGHMEPIGFKDGVTVLLELASVPALLALMSQAVAQIPLPSAQFGRQTLAGVAAAVLVLFLPALLLGGGGHHSASQLAAMSGHDHSAGGADHSSDHSDHADHGGHADLDGHGDHSGVADHGGFGDHAHDGEVLTSEGPGQTLTAHPHGGIGDHAASAPHGHAPGGAGGARGDGSEHARHATGSHTAGTADHHSDGHGGHRDGHGGNRDGHDGHRDGHGDSQDGQHSQHGDGGHDDSQHSDGQHDDGGHEGDHSEGGHGSGHGESEDRSGPPVPGVATQRVRYIEPKSAGTRETIKLQYGPHPVPPGGDANQVNLEFFGADGFIVSAKPVARYADGTVVGHADGMHLHHAHLFRRDTAEDDAADTRQGLDWVFGTGGEQTSGSFERISDAGPGDQQWGVRLNRGEPMLMVWMPMNMTEQTQVVFMEFEFTFVHGTAEEIKKSTGVTYRPLEPVMYGSTFNVPKTGDIYDWPLDARRPDGDVLSESDADPDSFGTSEPTEKSNVRPGVGEIWTAPSDGVIVGSAGHMHAGGRAVVVSNLGSTQQPCADDGDRFPGTTVLDSRAYYPEDIWPAHPLMGISQPGWRVPVQKGDRIAINGVFDSRRYAWPDQMSILGFYWDKNVSVSDDERCQARLADEPGASQAEAVASLPSQTASRGDDGSAWVHTSRQPCVADECDDYQAPHAPRGPHTNVVTIEDFTFTPGDVMRRSDVSGATGDSVGGAPVVEHGEKIRFVNLDFATKAGTRHAIASCSGPCNGPTGLASYPNSDGQYYSGPLGYLPLAEAASANNKLAPTWELDTSSLEPGYHTYFCWSHPWMRGAFYVEDMRGVGEDQAVRRPGGRSLPTPATPPTGAGVTGRLQAPESRSLTPEHTGPTGPSLRTEEMLTPPGDG